ncbi:RnfABCDGE type electron transport complex subunit G [Thermosipho atlanticus]|uniref:Ion-translocating oxidoreductase complex subunit G n=1 Tax=Thermosipho atlanticus DSM 15807 TaxID=1123380 RepID=A0A1M5R6Z8_9BACT|nr:RnfABCDGE type electron transport complex subunit G [Thermosipho atlanticus]SHH21958.1 electron transport complex protein RnfG [Thermosipho atlanticus DSM 15807]
MKEILKTGFTLMVFTLIAGLALGLIYQVTKGSIDNAELQNTLKAVKFVLSENGKLMVSKDLIEERINKTLKEKVKEVYKTDKATVLTPVLKFNTEKGLIYVLKAYGIGYGGKVITIASFIVNNCRIDLHAIKVIEYSQETPGLGAKIAEEEAQERFYPIPYEGLKNGVKVDKDAGKTNLKPEEAKKIGVVKISDVMTGATITPRAVANSIQAMFEYLKTEVKNNAQ